MDRRRLFTVLLVGVLLATNPVWLVPHATDRQHEYRASPPTTSDVHASDRVLVCRAEATSQACATERRAITDGVVVGRQPRAFADRPAFVYLAAERQYYRTSVRWVDGVRTATGVPVSENTVVDALATDVDSFEPRTAAVVTDALADGRASSRTRVVLDSSRPDGPVIVASDGSVATVRRTGRSRPPPFDGPLGVFVWLARGTLVAVGVLMLVGAVVAGRRRYGGN